MEVRFTTHHRAAEGDVFVSANDYDETIPNWRKVPEGTALEPGQYVVTCRLCDKPCVLMDCHWPWMSGACRCEDHDNFKEHPLDD